MSRGRSIGATLAAAVCVLSCNPAENTPPPYVVAHGPPERKDVIAALLATDWVRLDVDPSCEGVGTEASDATIGEYLSGFLAELASPDDTNWLETSAESTTDDSQNAVWRAEVIVRHAAGDDEWGWGVRFDVRQADRTVDPASLVCIGAG